MAQRSKLSQKGQKRLFNSTKNNRHMFNRTRPMRGGTRL